jgi:virginiamycin B lyase
MTKAVTLSVSRRHLLAICAALALALLGGAGMRLLWGAAPVARFVEYRMPGPHDGPMAIAAAADGTVWFTIDQADAIGRVRGGRLELLPTPGRNYEPLGLAVAADGSAWYTDIKAGAVMRISPSGEVAQTMSALRPLSPQQRRESGHSSTSDLCQFRTPEPQ